MKQKSPGRGGGGWAKSYWPQHYRGVKVENIKYKHQNKKLTENENKKFTEDENKQLTEDENKKLTENENKKFTEDENKTPSYDERTINL